MRRLAMLLSFVLVAPSALAQEKDKLPKWRIDPYTKNDPEAMAKAGYLNFGPFRFGGIGDQVVQSTEIDAALEPVQVLWLETAHFRIGVNLNEWVVPVDLPTRTKIRAELEELQQKLPKVNPKTKVLDPWLRAHMMAQRCEKLYAETQQLFGVTDKDFPADESKVIRMPGARYMGQGPYLGMQDKFLVLATQKMATFQTYMKRFLGKDHKFAQRWHFRENHSILIALPIESEEFPLKHDTALHCALAFNLSQNFLDGFRHYSYNLPVWLREGFGHWNCRRVDTKWPNFTGDEGGMPDVRVVDKWNVLTRNLIAQGKVSSFAETAGWRSFTDIKFPDHVAIWSRVDWLLAQDVGSPPTTGAGPSTKWQKFLFAIKGRVDAEWNADQNDLVGAIRDALKDAYGVSTLDIDTKWAEWVKATYPAQ